MRRIRNRWDTLRERFGKCEKCALAQHRRNIVLGRGKLPAQLCFVGEAPGAIEDARGLAFTGASGELLDEAIDAAGIDPKRCAWANTVACRPEGNRKPAKEERIACAEILRSVLVQTQPRGIVLLGWTARQYAALTALAVVKGWDSICCLPHPAWLLRNGGKKSKDWIRYVDALRAFALSIGMKIELRGKKEGNHGKTIRIIIHRRIHRQA